MPLLPRVSLMRTWEHPASWDAHPWVIVLTVARLDFGILAANPSGFYLHIYAGWIGVELDWGE